MVDVNIYSTVKFKVYGKKDQEMKKKVKWLYLLNGVRVRGI